MCVTHRPWLPKGCWKWLSGAWCRAAAVQWQMPPTQTSACPGQTLAPLWSRNPFFEQAKTALAPWEMQGTLAPSSGSCTLVPQCPSPPSLPPGWRNTGLSTCNSSKSDSLAVFQKRRSLKWEAPPAKSDGQKHNGFAWILDKKIACFFIAAPPPTATFTLYLIKTT